MPNINPLAKLLAAAVVSLVLLLTLDPVSGAVALVIELCLLPFAGVPARKLWDSLAPLLIAAPLAGLSTLLYGRGGGELLATIGPWSILSGNVLLAIAITIRVLAIVLPAVVLFASTDATDLADALAQLWRLPARFVIGALAAIRMLGLMGDDWRMLGMARRARGVRGEFSRPLAFLTIAIRRGSLLATAMEARGFDSRHNRSWARSSRWSSADTLFVAGAVLVALAAITVSILTGAWNFVIK
jgi:energy-coupling factor transport system permease protein